MKEKEIKVKNMLTIVYGVPRWIDWLAWFTKIFIEHSPIALLLFAVFTYDFYFMDPFFPYTNHLVIFTHLLIYMTTLCTMTMLISTFFRSINTATILSVMLLLLSMLPEILVNQDNLKEVSVASLFFCSSSFVMCLHIFLIFEETGLGVQWKHVWQSPSTRMYSVGVYWIAMLCMNIVHVMISLYIESVFEAHRNWYFPVEFFVNWALKNKESKTEIPLEEKYYKESCALPPVGSIPSVDVVRITKKYNNLPALENVSLVLYEDQVTVLLGGAGSGKSTLIRLLTGYSKPTFGNAYIYGQDVWSKRTEVMDYIGYCPQNNILLPELTGKENLIFFGQLKGLSFAAAVFQGKSLMNKLGLGPGLFLDTVTANYAEANKRLISLSIALIGPSKTIFLDEPTVGVKRDSKKVIWSLLQEMKKDRTIMLSTKFTNEAELVGDRIVIVHKGELQCSGSSYYLKNSFATNYKLVIE